MKTAIVTIITLVIFLSPQKVVASTYEQLINPNIDPGAVEVGESLISPDSPIYPLKMFRERVELLFNSSAQARVFREMEFSIRRLREANKLIKQDKQELIGPTLERYMMHINTIEMLTESDENLKVSSAELLAPHFFVLQQLYNKISNEKAKQAVLAAIIRDEQFVSLALEKLSLEKQQQLIKKIALRQAVACGFIMMESTSSALLDNQKQQLQVTAQDCKTKARDYLKDQLEEILRKEDRVNLR